VYNDFMPFISLRFDESDEAMLERVCRKYGCGRTQAVRLGLKLLDANPLLQVELPPRRKPGPKPKQKAPHGPR
jgi:hypothetical protein